MNFLKKILPEEGLVCVASPYPNGGFKHSFFDTIDEAQEFLIAQDEAGKTLFVAQATFKTRDSRKQANALYLKNFFMDIDCGEDKGYPSQKDATDALKKFVADTGLPFPAVVSSGNGLYAHWPLQEMVPAEQWKTIAYILKQATVAYEFNVDQSRTGDSASVLRPVGATHRKDPTNPKKVQLLRDCDPVKFSEFADALRKAAKKKHIDTTKAATPKPSQDITADFMAGLEGLPSSGVRIAERCAQVRKFRDSEGNIEEPLWYASLGILAFCSDGGTLMQEWSAGHAGYSPAATAEKAEQYKNSGYGPSTCAKLGEINPTACIGCPHNGQIKSPIVLGRPDPVAVVEVNEETGEEVESELPTGFRLAEDGLYFDDEGKWTRFYDQDLRVVRIAFDESLGYQVAIVRHTLPFDGQMGFTMRSSLVHDPKALVTFLSDNHVHVVGVKAKKVMVAYMESYLAKLQRQRSMTQLLNQMGWKNANGKSLFVLGKNIFHADGEVESASLARHVPGAAHGFRSEGDLNKWVEATALLDRPSMEPCAFALLCGFAAPLMKFTGFDGAMVSLNGESGIGKTLMLRWVQSIYGYHNDLMMLRDDTKNALVSRLGVYGNLPLTVDEVTNIDGMDLSDLVYRITQGRDKARLTKNAEERKNLNGWNTLAIVSSNSSLVEKLSGIKHDASAEVNRLFEYDVHAVEGFSGTTTSDLYWTINNNFGYAGEKYIGWLAQHQAQVNEGLAKTQTMIEKKIDLQGDERFWGAVVATAIYGGLVAQKLGLIRFNVSRVCDWAEKVVSNMRSDKQDASGDAVGILGQFLDEHANNRVLVRGDCTGGKQCVLIETPKGPLVIRHEIDKDRLFFSRNVFKTWISRRFGAYSKIRSELISNGALKHANRIKVLGAGTSYAGASQPCWEIDLSCVALGQVGLKAVQTANTYRIDASKEAGA